ncbi:MAG: glycosyltransferase, partial [Ilumatobacter sp.]|nr:glycosyltransferase [Ilumatobacter sp.]
FGAPLVEAMAAGTPVVCSDAAAVREVVGDAAIVVDGDGEAEALAAGVAAARDRRDELVAAGHERRRRFTIERSGAAITAAYRRAVER